MHASDICSRHMSSLAMTIILQLHTYLGETCKRTCQHALDRLRMLLSN